MTMTNPSRASSLMQWVRGAGLALARQIAKFGVVGGIAFFIDVTVFNILLYAGESPILAGQPLWAKVVSSAVATVASWLGNRYWTFRHTRRPQAWREFGLFVMMCTIGLGLALSCLAISHYVLGLQSALADNIAANVVGLAVGTTFRFWAYRRFVFTHDQPAAAGQLDEQDDDSTLVASTAEPRA
jgi:putative flippase GtrA